MAATDVLAKVESAPAAPRCLGALALWVLLSAAILVAPSRFAAGAVGRFYILNTIRLSLAYWFVALLFWLRLRAADWHGGPRVAFVRCCWTLGWAAFVLHLLAAWHYYHGWSHDHAVEHTEAVSGVGWGIHVSHFFTALWTLDVALWWIWPDGHATRPVSLEYLLHGFMAFVIFCGTVVYESGPIRWIGAAAFAVLALAWVARLVREPGG